MTDIDAAFVQMAATRLKISRDDVSPLPWHEGGFTPKLMFSDQGTLVASFESVADADRVRLALAVLDTLEQQLLSQIVPAGEYPKCDEPGGTGDTIELAKAIMAVAL